MNENSFSKAVAKSDKNLSGKNLCMDLLNKYSDLELHTQLKSKVEYERELLSEVISFIQEVDSRRMYFKFGYPSLFEYLTKEMKYSNGSAQRRISAARLLKDIPEFKTDLEEGYLNLGQIAIVSQGLKQKEKEVASNQMKESKSTSTVEVESALSQKKDLLQKVMGQTLPETLKIVSQTLDLELKPQEKKTIQKDESVHLSITLSKEEAQTLQKAKELISHINPGAKDLDVIVLALKELVKRKDPALKKVRVKKDITVAADFIAKEVEASESTSTVEVNVTCSAGLRKPISNPVKKALFQKYSYCQWKGRHSKGVCGSKFQLQIDHIKPIWAGGTHDEGNLQVLCSAHNRLKYLRESGRL